MKYISGIFKTGAVRKTPKRIINKIVNGIEPRDSMNVIEFGAGKGEITKRIVDKSVAGISYYAFEIDKNFVAHLNEALPGIQVVDKDAFGFDKAVPVNYTADYIICSIPLSFYSKKDIQLLVEKMKTTLKKNGRLFILLHAFWILPFLKKQLPGVKQYSFFTFPPYYLLVYDKEREL